MGKNSQNPQELYVISDFNCDPLCRFLERIETHNLAVKSTPYGQVFQALSKARESSGDGYLIWTLPERIISNFAKACEFQEIDTQDCMIEVDQFSDTILDMAEAQNFVFVVAWTTPLENRGYGILDWRPGLGLSNIMAQMNLRMAERLSNAKNIFIIDPRSWFANIANPASPKMWYASKVPYSSGVFENAARYIDNAVKSINGIPKKIIILDLDDTLWGGVVGEVGWEGIRLGGHDFLGEAFSDFQKSLKALSSRGIQLAIVSKNDEKVALEAIDKHPEMQLRRNDFAGWRINWKDKAENIVSLLTELNLSLDAAVFIDDNPVERDRIQTGLPDVMVPAMQKDPTSYASLIMSLDCFESPFLGIEDRNRTALYAAERQRRETKALAGSHDAWLERLGTVVKVANLNKSNLTRVAQLMNRTNQLNLSTRRLSETEIEAWISTENRNMFAISTSDCFGDAGIVGVISIEKDGDTGRLVDFILSCRVMGRMVEEALLSIGAHHLMELGVTTMEVCYLPTARNRPTLEVLEKSDLTRLSDDRFIAQCKDGLPFPSHIAIKIVDE